MNILQKICLCLTIIGAINWGMVGLFNIDLVKSIFGDMTLLSRVIYSLISVAGIINIALLFIDLDHKPAH
jgi:uncharacterized protein